MKTRTVTVVVIKCMRKIRAVRKRRAVLNVKKGRTMMYGSGSKMQSLSLSLSL